MWTYFFGSIFAIFPAPWRESLPFAKNVVWRRATAINGFAEAALALVAMMYWYSYAMSTWVDNGVSVALSGKLGPGVRPQDIGGAALIVWWMHPVTWLIAYFGIEGAVRLCAGAFGGNSCGILPLFLADKIIFGPFRRRKDEAGAGANVSSFAGAIGERVRTARLPEVPDELCFSEDESGEILEIYACRRKLDWTPPRVVRYFDAYYRLEADSSGAGTRPFRYRLRRLAAGVPSRSVLLYAPEDAIIRTVAKHS
ncbi:MAG: hypothetical protein WCA19_04815 [Candidatus Acidiferrales bacterium]